MSGDDRINWAGPGRTSAESLIHRDRGSSSTDLAALPTCARELGDPCRLVVAASIARIIASLHPDRSLKLPT
ncbi:hypothetical protein ASF48_16465 [Rathayibacter sp. Leaf299]|nr:hypothetical protein ASF48_16465 [Rathayibacter sp. Leaf299]